jgi:5-methylcytosine-specific restriction endonuclease McrA
MKLTPDFSPLERIAERLGAPTRDIVLGPVELDELNVLRVALRTGVEVELKDVEVNAGGLLAFKGHHVVLYIPDQGRHLSRVLADPGSGKKVHVAECATLERMKSEGRFERYVVRNGLAPLFKVTGVLDNGREIDDAEAQLRVCINCLKKLNYKGYNNAGSRAQKTILGAFSLPGFFSTYSSYFEQMPSRSEADIQINNYPEDWAEMSTRRREAAGWRCEKCTVELYGRRDLLHVHHRDGNRTNNSPSNLVALCADCHSKEPHHQGMFVTRAERQAIQRLRREQKRYTPPKSSTTSSEKWSQAKSLADPAVFGLLDELMAQGYDVPEVGGDVLDGTSRVICSNVELLWRDLKEAVLLSDGADANALSSAGWTVFFPQQLLDDLQSQRA